MTEFVALLHNPAHWGFEMFSDMVLAVPAFLVGRWRLRTHDATHHPKEVNA